MLDRVQIGNTQKLVLVDECIVLTRMADKHSAHKMHCIRTRLHTSVGIVRKTHDDVVHLVHQCKLARPD